MSDEQLELTWHVGKGDGPDERPDTSPCKVYFCLKWGEEIIEHREFTKAELKEELDKLHKAGERPTDYEEALRELSAIG